MELCFGWFLLVASIPAIFAQDISHGSIVVDGTMTVAQTDDNFVCATIDWWPHDKCNYDQCPWHYTSVMNLNLSHPFLAKAIQGVSVGFGYMSGTGMFNLSSSYFMYLEGHISIPLSGYVGHKDLNEESK